jgi:MFS transporter, PAT family, beta-lactamase induction signal transducer AmpG
MQTDPFTPAPDGLVLEASHRLRLFTLFILYVGQGMPIGLFFFAVPAWMAANGASAAEVGSVAALTALPWSLKLVNGFIMDRYTFLPMGRRRAWVIGAQSVMIAWLIIAALLNPAVSDVAILGAIGFTVNLATTFQDVAVDGLAVDIMTEDERARGSGMMFGGQSIGVAAATAMCGVVLEDYGAPTAFLIVAAIIALLSLYITGVRERAGERPLPWSAGRANPRNLDIQIEAWWPLLKATFRALARPVSLLFLPVMFGRGIAYGAFAGGGPLIGANYASLGTGDIASLTASAGLVAGVLCMTLGGWLGDRFGAKRIAIMWLCVGLAMFAGMYWSEPLWGEQRLFTAFVFGWIALDMLLTVATLPIPMRLCDAKVAATQFTIYMAVANFGISFGGFMLGQSEALGGLPSIFLTAGAGYVVALVLLLTVKFPRRPEYYAKQAEMALVLEGAGMSKVTPGAPAA